MGAYLSPGWEEIVELAKSWCRRWAGTRQEAAGLVVGESRCRARDSEAPHSQTGGVILWQGKAHIESDLQ